MLKQFGLIMGILIFLLGCSHNTNNFKSLKITEKEIQTKNKGIKSLSETIFENTPLLDICYKSSEDDEVVVKTEKKVNYYSSDEKDKITMSLQGILNTISENKKLNIWIVVEPLRDTEVIDMLRNIESNYVFLFNNENNIFKKVGAVGISINNNPKMVQWVINNWGKQWFTIFVSSLNNANTIAHMRNLAHITIDKKGNTKYLFRYYDPIIFSSWMKGLIKAKKYKHALSPFVEILAEGHFPHIIKRFQIHSDTEAKEYDLRANTTYPKNTKIQNKKIFLKRPWHMGSSEYSILSEAATTAFKIKLSKNLIAEYKLLNKYTLAEVYTIVNTEVERAIKYNMTRKDVLAHFVNIYFEHEVFWKNNQYIIQKTLERKELSEVDRMEIILKAASDEESNI